MSIFKEIGVREGKDRTNEEVVYNIARAYGVVNKVVTDILAEFDLSPAKFNILLMVKHVGKQKGLAQNEISKLLLVTTSNITRMVDKLEKDGLVKREAFVGDRRINTIKITSKGSTLLDRAWKPYKNTIDKTIGTVWSKSDKKNIVNMLSELRIN